MASLAARILLSFKMRNLSAYSAETLKPFLAVACMTSLTSVSAGLRDMLANVILAFNPKSSRIGKKVILHLVVDLLVYCSLELFHTADAVTVYESLFMLKLALGGHLHLFRQAYAFLDKQTILLHL